MKLKILVLVTLFYKHFPIKIKGFFKLYTTRFSPDANGPLCSRNFQNVKLRHDFVETWSFSSHSDFTKIQFWQIQTSKNVIFGNLLDSEFWIFGKFGTWKLLKFNKIKIQIVCNCQKWQIGPFEFAKMWFHVKTEWL